MSKLYVIRHAQVDAVPDIPPEQWHLSPEGVLATNRMIENEDWSRISCIYHSSECKAMETAALVAQANVLPMKVEYDLRELTTTMGFVDTRIFYDRVGAYLEGNNDPDFEDYQEATKRVVNCVTRILTEAEGNSVAIVSHGRILSVFFSYILGRRICGAEWRAMKFSDLSVIDTDTWTVDSGFLAR